MRDTSAAITTRFRVAATGCIVGLLAVAVAPFLLDTYLTNILIRTLFLAAVVMTVDILWGTVGILTFGQSAFFGIGAYACGLIFTHYGFGPGWALAGLALGIGVAAIVAAATGSAFVLLRRGPDPRAVSADATSLPTVNVVSPAETAPAPVVAPSTSAVATPTASADPIPSARPTVSAAPVKSGRLVTPPVPVKTAKPKDPLDKF